MIKNRYRSVSFLTLAALAAGCSAGAAGNSAPEEATLPRATTVTPSTTQAAHLDPAKVQWRRQMSKAPPTKEGCYAAAHPSMEWVEVPCGTARHSPPPHRPVTTPAGSPAENAYPGAVLGPVAPDSSPASDAADFGRANAEPSSKAPEGALAGSGTIRPETSGTVSSGTISWAEGSFPSATDLTGENDNGTANDFSLQLNTQSNFTNSAVAALCKSTATPSSCTGWVQFVYWEGAAEIWYNLINTGSTCPSSAWQNVNGSCYYEAPKTSAIAGQAISNLPNMTLTGIAGGATDTVIVETAPGQIYAAVNTSVLDLAPDWTYADFNVLGNGSYGTASFNTGTTLGVQLLTDSATGNTSAPSCGPYNSTTGEGNDLSFVTGSCCTFGGETPGIQFTESNASNPTALACPKSAKQTPDLLWWNETTGQFSAWELNNSGTVTTTRTLSATCTLASGCANDWNVIDAQSNSLLWTDPTNGQVSTWEFDPTGHVSIAPSYSWTCTEASGCTASWQPVGRLMEGTQAGLLWDDPSTGTLSVWELSGTTVTGAQNLSWTCGAGCSSVWHPVLTADMNNDGNTDVVWYDESTGVVSSWLLNGSTVLGTQNLSWTCTSASGCAADWSIVGAADVNGDGHTDLTWWDRSTGQVSSWLLNGSGGVLGTQLLSWTCSAASGCSVPGAWHAVGFVSLP
jgi:hypothetical protein